MCQHLLSPFQRRILVLYLTGLKSCSKFSSVETGVCQQKRSTLLPHHPKREAVKSQILTQSGQLTIKLVCTLVPDSSYCWSLRGAIDPCNEVSSEGSLKRVVQLGDAAHKYKGSWKLLVLALCFNNNNNNGAKGLENQKLIKEYMKICRDLEMMKQDQLYQSAVEYVPQTENKQQHM